MRGAEHITVPSALGVLALAILQVPSSAQATQLASVVPGTGDQRDQPAAHPGVNSDGSYVVYDGSTLHWTGGYQHVMFLFGVDTGVTTPVVPWADGSCYNARFSDNDRYLVFHSSSRNLHPGDTHVDSDVYVVDLVTGAVDWASVAWDGSNTGGQAQYADISGDGRHVVFESQNMGLTLDPDGNPWSEVFVRDRVAGTTVLMCRSLTGTTGNGISKWPVISGDGRYVAFTSSSSDLIVGDTNNMMDIFVCDRDPDGNGIFDEGNATLVRVSLADDGTQANNSGLMPSISSDGRYVAWDSHANNLVAGDHMWPGSRIYLADRDPDENGIFDEGNGTVEFANLNSLGEQAYGSCMMPRLSHDGRKLAFYAGTTNLVANAPVYQSIYHRDLDTGQTRLVSVDSQGTYANSDSGLNYWSDGGTAIAGDGSAVAFYSGATNLVASDTNGWPDVFVHTPAADPGIDLGFYMAGSNGAYPVLSLNGPMKVGQPTDLWLRFGPATQFAWLLASDGYSPFPYRGGTIVPSLIGYTLFGPFPTDVDGRVDFTFTAPPLTQPFTVYAQWILFDPGLPQIMGLSNGLTFEIQL